MSEFNKEEEEEFKEWLCIVANIDFAKLQLANGGYKICPPKDNIWGQIMLEAVWAINEKGGYKITMSPTEITVDNPDNTSAGMELQKGPAKKYEAMEEILMDVYKDLKEKQK